MLIRILLITIISFSAYGSEPTPPVQWQSLFPHATSVGEKQTQPAVWPVYQVGNLVGYVFESIEFVAIPAFSGEPVNLLVGVDLQGNFAGVELLEHKEPIFLHGLGEEPLLEFLTQYSGLSLKDNIKVGGSRSGATKVIDGITKATASVVVINESVLLSALKVARQTLAGFEARDQGQPRQEIFEPMTFAKLQDLGFVRNRQLIYQEVQEAFKGTPVESYPSEGDFDAQDQFIDYYVAYLNAPNVGKNLLGDKDYQRLLNTLKPGEQAIAVFSTGEYSFTGEDFVPASIPNRLILHQGEVPIEIRDMNFYDYDTVHSPYLENFDSYKLFRIKPQSEFDPGSPWRLSLVVSRSRGMMFDAVHSQFAVNYELPKHLFTYPQANTAEVAVPLWVTLWQNRVGEIIALILSLVLLTAILIYQHQLVRYRTVFVGLRWGFLAFTLLVLGFYSQGQLSVVNIFTVLQTWLHGFNIETFLIDPIIFILWIYVFATLFLWGRGVFCGWLCPFGALQEILSALARKLNIRQIRIKQPLHQRLWMLKYVILLVLVALSFYSLDKAEVASEVEPFKTAITLVFVRSWPFVLYAVLLLAMGLFVHKFYCRYVCPLGAGLAILGKLRLFSWLSRRDACGQPCQLCRHKCEIDAISPAGKINYDECIQCLECIVYYNADDLCPPQIAIAKRQRRRTPPTDLIPVVSQT